VDLGAVTTPVPLSGPFLLVGGTWRGYGDAKPTPPPPNPDPEPAPTPGSYTFESSALQGGGFQNVIAVSPFLDDDGNRPYLIGADVSGPFRSVNRGGLWLPANNGSVSNSMRVAAIMWSDSVPGTVYLAEDNGLHGSTNWGQTWARRAAGADVDWDANNANGSPEHPRQTGFMLAQDNTTSTKYLWAGTLTKGVRQSIDGGATWRTTVLQGAPIRGIALDPNNRDVLYAAVARGTAAQNGMWRITGARSATMTATKMASYPGAIANPAGPEEVIALSSAGQTVLIVAGHVSGMYRYRPATGVWTAINSGLAIGTPVYQSVCADPTNPQIIYCGNWHPSNRRSIWRSINQGDTWVPITGPNPVEAPATGPIVIDWTEFGGGVRSWLEDIPYHSFAGPNADWLPAMLAIDPDVTNRVLAAGRGGAWWGTLTSGVRTWQPAVRGLLVTVCMAVAADPLVDGRVLVGNMDYTNLYSTDSMASVRQSKNPSSESTGDTVTFDMAVTSGAGRAFYGASQRGQNTGVGSIYSTDTPELWTGSHWTDEVGGAFNSDVTALAVGKTSGGTRVILAGTSQPAGTTKGGLWRKVGATWTQFRSVTGNPFGLADTAAAANMGCLRFRRNSAVVYALDNDALWRSDDAGATWTKLLTGVSAVYGTYNALELDPTDTAKVYVSSGGTVRRVNNASTSTGTGTTTTTTIWSGQAGNIALHPDGSAMFINVRDGRLMRSTAFRTAASQSAAAWVDVSSPFFRQSSGNIRSLAVTPGGVVLTADNGSGALRGIPH
jgi:hypothetical protein